MTEPGDTKLLEHTWTFAAATGGSDDRSHAIAIAICTACGSTRKTAAGGQLDLTGLCEARPDVPDPAGPTIFSRRR